MAELKTLVSFDEIQGFTDVIVERFKPQIIVLFGSYASGAPTGGSDPDLLVVMSVPPNWEQAHLIRCDLQRRFPAPLQIIFMMGGRIRRNQRCGGGHSISRIARRQGAP